MPNDLQENLYPRLHELHEISEGANTHLKDWVQTLLRHSSTNAMASEVASRIESELAELPEQVWHEFKLKLLKQRSAPSELRGYSKLGDILNEAKGYTVLRDILRKTGIEFHEIIPVQEGSSRTPDWAARFENRTVALLEVKTIRESEFDVQNLYEDTQKLINGTGTARRANPVLPEELWNKLDKTIRNADNQMTKYAGSDRLHKVLLLVVTLDTKISMHTPNYQIIRNSLENYESADLKIVCLFNGAFVPS